MTRIQIHRTTCTYIDRRGVLVRGKTVQVVSNNNSATQNVFERLASPKYDMGFLVAALGKRENKQVFIDGQTGLYPPMKAWEKTPEDLKALQTQVEQLSKEVAEHFGKQERLAVARQELDALEVEAQYFLQFRENTKPFRPKKKSTEKPAFGYSSAHPAGMRAAQRERAALLLLAQVQKQCHLWHL